MENRISDTTNGQKLVYREPEESKPTGNYLIGGIVQDPNIGLPAGKFIFKQPISTKAQDEKLEVININALITKTLKQSIQAILEPDEEGFIARLIDLPLYAFSEDSLEAINNLKEEIESLYEELKVDDNFSDEWLLYRQFLEKIIID